MEGGYKTQQSTFLSYGLKSLGDDSRFVAFVGINAVANLVSQLSGIINPAILMDGVAGARSHSCPAREAAKEEQSSVPRIGFPLAYAVSGTLPTVFGYFAIVLAR